MGTVAALAVTLRVVHVFFMGANPLFDVPTMDAAYHLEWARAIAAGERFQEGPFFRAPLYPAFLGLTQIVFGAGLLAPRLLQALAGGATAVLTYLVGKRVADHRVGLLAALFAATYWVLVYFDGELLIPTLAVPLDLAALYVTLGLGRARRDRRPLGRRAAWAGVLWGLSASARPNVLLFLPFLALWLVLWPRASAGSGAPRRAGWIAAAALAAGSLVPVLPITAINRVRGGEWVLISTQAGVNLWIGNNPESDGSTAIVPGTRGGWWEGYHDAVARAEAGAGRSLSASGVSRFYSAKTWGWIAAHPGDALAHLLWKARLFWTNAELGNNQEVTFFAHHFDPLMRFLPLRFDLLVGLAALGLILALRRAGATFPLWGFVAVYSASVVAFFVCSRYRLPVLPPLMVLAAAAVLWLWERARARGWRALGGGLSLTVAVALATDLRPAALRPSAGLGHLQLGTALAAAGDPAAAVPHFEAALDRIPDDPYALRGLAGAARDLGDPGRAERLCRQGLAALEARRRAGRPPLPGGPELRAALVDALNGLGRHRDARREALRFLAADGAQPQVRYGLGAALAKLGEYDEAVRELELTLAADPSATYALDLLLQVLEAAGREAEAQEWRRYWPR